MTINRSRQMTVCTAAGITNVRLGQLSRTTITGTVGATYFMGQHCTRQIRSFEHSGFVMLIR
jgi:hypothetical protein